MNIKKYVLIAIIAIIGIGIFSSIANVGEDVKNEEIVVNQFPFTGNIEVWNTPGFHWQWFGNTTHYYKTQQVWFGADGNGEPIDVRFNDFSDGKIYGSLRIKLPMDEGRMRTIYTEYKSMDRVMNELVRQTVGKAIYTTGTLMTGVESAGEKKNAFLEYMTDQLKYGVYKTTTVRVETVDPISGEKRTRDVASLIVDPTAPGGYARVEEAPFSVYGIELGQVAINKIDYSKKVNDQIAQQQEANMLIATSKAKAAAAQQEAIRAEEEGKAAAAKAKWEQERVKAVEVTKAEQAREVSRLAAEKAEFDKKKIIAEGQAEAEANRLKVAAGLTPQERAEWEYKTKVGVAEALAKVQLPKIVATGGNGGGNQAMEAMGLKMLVDLNNQMSK